MTDAFLKYYKFTMFQRIRHLSLAILMPEPSIQLPNTLHEPFSIGAWDGLHSEIRIYILHRRINLLIPSTFSYDVFDADEATGLGIYTKDSSLSSPLVKLEEYPVNN